MFAPLMRFPFRYLLSTCLVAIVALPLLLLLTALTRVDAGIDQIALRPSVYIFLKPAVNTEEVSQVEAKINSVLEREALHVDLQFIDKEQALENITQQLALQNIKTSLNNNPLPNAYVAYLYGFKGRLEDTSYIQRIIDSLLQEAEVAQVYIDVDRANAVAQQAKLIRYLSFSLLSLFSIAIVTVLLNQIQLKNFWQAREVSAVNKTKNNSLVSSALAGIVFAVFINLCVFVLQKLSAMIATQYLADWHWHQFSMTTLINPQLSSSLTLFLVTAIIAALAECLFSRRNLE